MHTYPDAYLQMQAYILYVYAFTMFVYLCTYMYS